MDDDRNVIERAEAKTKNLSGEPMSIEDMVDDFALYGVNRRAEALEKVDAELRGEIGSGAHALRRHARLMGLRAKIGSLHEALRKAKR